MFRKLHRPRILQPEGTKRSTKVQCYFVVVIMNSLSPIKEGERWYEGVITLGHLCKKICTIQSATMRKLAMCMEVRRCGWLELLDLGTPRQASATSTAAIGS